MLSIRFRFLVCLCLLHGEFLLPGMTVTISPHLEGLMACAGGAMGSADEVNIQASELNRTMKVCPRSCILTWLDAGSPISCKMLLVAAYPKMFTHVLHTDMFWRLSVGCRR